MNYVYDQVLYYTHRFDHKELLNVMKMTNDDFLSKKIKIYMNSFTKGEEAVEEALDSLHAYIDHAVGGI